MSDDIVGQHRKSTLAAVIGALLLPVSDATDIGPTGPMTSARNSLISDEWRSAVLDLHNDFRRKLARGELEGKAGKLPAAADMNEIQNWDYNAEMMALTEAKKCGPTFVVPTADHLNVYKKIDVTKSCNVIDEAKKAIEDWWDQFAAKQENNTYQGEIYSPLAYSQAKAIGCSYHSCSSKQLNVVCLFYNLIDEHVGKDLYTPSSTGCTCTDCIDDLCPSTFSPGKRRLVATGWAADRKITYAKPAKTMMELTYDQALENAAIAYLNKTDDCPTTPEDKNYVGENFWISTYSLPSEKTVEKAIGEWFSYLGNEGLGKNLDYSSLKTDSAKKLGNVIHDKTEKIGCAFKACEKSGAIVIDCRYEPLTADHSQITATRFMNILIIFLVAIPNISVAVWPEQVHLAFHGDYSVMAVIWTTFQYDDAEVSYGEDPNKLLYTATHEGVKQWMSGSSARYSHRAMMRNLKPSTNYYYQIGARSFSFNTLPENPQTYKACIFGDLGYFHGNSTASLIKNGLAGKFDFIVHLGDIAYDLHTKNGTTGDNYMNQLEPLFSKVPYMVIAGNHEDDGKNFTDYQERFWMPHNGYGDNQFYSFDLGPVHWVGISTEYYGYYYIYGEEPVLTQYEWLKNDLTIRTGWLDMPGLESLFLQQGMDVGFWGHEHSYERFYPIADKQFWNDTNAYNNPNAPVYVISGSAGCHTPYTEFSENPWPFSAARVNDYGYSILTIANSTHIHLEQISIEKGDTVVDEMVSDREVEMESSRRRRSATRSKRRRSLTTEPISSSKKEREERASKSSRSERSPQTSRRIAKSRSEREESTRESRPSSPKTSKRSPTTSSRKRYRKKRSRSRRREVHKCSLHSHKCPEDISHKQLTEAAARDRHRREEITIRRMIEGNGMTDIALWRAMKRQSAYSSMRGLALYLQCICILTCGLMALMAQSFFNTRGDLNFYLCQLTFELFLYMVVLCNITAPSHFVRFACIALFVIAVGVNFSHILIVVRTEGLYWKCEEGGIIMQHCFFLSIPTHYHTLYTAAFLLFVHLANALVCVAISIFYDGSLDWYLEQTPGAPQWITNEPLHQHDRVEEATRKAKETNLIRKLREPLKMTDFPPGTIMRREQTEYSVRTTTFDRKGKMKVGPEHVTMSRSYTLKAPGKSPATGRRQWVMQRPAPDAGISYVPAKDVKSTPAPNIKSSSIPKVVLKSSEKEKTPTGKTPQNVEVKPPRAAESKPTGIPIEVSFISSSEKRTSAGKEPEIHDVPPSLVSKMPPLISPLVILSNRNMVEKKSDYMF
ncbi:hypothetical protein RB195_016241 [Necator americanus]|uniref:Purple acid phosphatase n=1 Tax=Necator americanus TaxID=51031 RepID=A0ABR1E8F8_NECAM